MISYHRKGEGGGGREGEEREVVTYREGVRHDQSCRERGLSGTDRVRAKEREREREIVNRFGALSEPR